jgi:hypothetical protein
MPLAQPSGLRGESAKHSPIIKKRNFFSKKSEKRKMANEKKCLSESSPKWQNVFVNPSSGKHKLSR